MADTAGRVRGGRQSAASGHRSSGPGSVSRSASMTRRASTGPTPSCSRSSRNQARSPAGLATILAAAMKSLTCAASVNLSPPYLTYGMPRADSSISSRSLWCAARTSTA